MKINGKVAVITGATGSIGSSLVEKLYENGVHCYLIDKKLEDLNRLKNIYKNATFISSDFSDLSNVQETAHSILKFKIGIDIIINIAGVGVYKPIGKLDSTDIISSININLTAPFILINSLVSSLNKNSLVLNIGSGMGMIPTQNRSAYCASKFGLRGLSLSIAKDLKTKSVDVCLVSLGSVMTNFGTGGLKQRLKLQNNGKKYLSIDQVVNKIFHIIKSDKRNPEYIVFPKGYKK